jgi:redox-sensitive bicupin YhaK (pirin superfamily)
MSNISLIIEERAASIGNFLVGRLLPFKQKRSVGPFVFIDHMGPVTLNEHENFDVPAHPHIGLSTLTYLFEGAMMHRDSTGAAMEIKPGEVNWMTAGRGVVHSERTPEHLRNSEKKMHGLQIWVALPLEMEECDPSFAHFDAELIPSWKTPNADFKLIAGSLFGYQSPVPVHSKLYFLEIRTVEGCELDLGNELFGESALYILQGAVTDGEHTYTEKQILIAGDQSNCKFQLLENTTIYIFGGEPFAQERYIDWNFVSHSKERLAKAREDWKAQLFDKIPGETEFVPYPETKLH